jgi:ribosome biogenesis GTPase
LKGRIVRLKAGVYSVKNENALTHCKARGLFRHQNIDPRVGDLVTFNETDEIITELHPRHSLLRRPSIANVDQAFIVLSAKEPDFSFILLDRFLVQIEDANIKEGVIIISKMDLLDENETVQLKKALSLYEPYYPVFYIRKDDSSSIDPLKVLFKDKLTVLAGQTGAGKSSLMNLLAPHLNLKTAEISKALGRGKHTTRHVELWDLYDGFIADTPGFSKLDFTSIDATDLRDLFKDFIAYQDDCKFRTCKHLEEPGCAVKKAVEKKEISETRYTSYKKILEEMSQSKGY